MFTRLRETVRILSYHEPNTGPHGPDVHFVVQEPQHFSKTRLNVAKLVQAVLAVYIVGKLATPCTTALEKLLQGHHPPTATSVAGGIGALLIFGGHWLRQRIEGAIQKRVRLEEILAPYFGRRLENAIRTLKGVPRAT